MRRLIFPLAVCLSLTVPGAAQAQEGDKDSNQNQPPPRSERSREAGESSSRDTRIDLSPPPNDAKDHPSREMRTGRIRSETIMMSEFWVICVNCGKRYYLERYNNNGCPLCGSKEYEYDEDIDIEEDLDVE
jgi:rubrerythrin